MPRPAKGIRLWADKAAGYWVIRDGSRKRGTGCRLEEREGAEKALAEYIAERYEPPSDHRASKLLVADVLTYYAREIAPGQKSSATSYAVENLIGWWKSRPLSDVRRSTCQAYVMHRTSQPIPQAKTEEAKKRKVSAETARRELTVLRAAINAYHAETPLDALPVVTLPEASPPRDRWMTRQEAASLLRAARKLDDRDSGRALARFIILGIYTGSRSGVIRRLGWLPNTIGGWIDLTSGVIHRRADGETETKKRRPPVRIPGRMIGFLRRWRAEDMRQSEDHKPIPFVIHYRGKPVDKQRKAWAEACRVAGLGNDVMPHILRHTAVTWMMQAGNDPWDVSGYVGMSLKMLEDVYGHHHPDHQKGIAGRIGRK